MADICVLTNDEIGAAIGANDSVPASALLAARAVSLWIDANFGAMVQRTVIDERRDGGGYSIRVSQYPIVSITALTESDGDTPHTLTVDTDFLTISQEGVIYRRSQGWPRLFDYGQRNIAITYVAGRYTDQSLVPEDVKLAAQVATAHIHSTQHGSGSDTYGSPLSGFLIPNAAKELLDGSYGPQRGRMTVA